MPRKRPKKVFKDISYDKGAEDRKKIRIALIIMFGASLNLLLLFFIGFRTLIPTTLLICSYPILTIMGYLLFKNKLSGDPGLQSFVIFPSVINCFLLLNYIICFNPKYETYKFSRNTEVVTNRSGNYRRSQTNTLITLDNNAYKNYYGIRVFSSEDKILPANRITYTFETGILGIRVMTDYAF